MNSWLALVTSLPTENATVRQRAWRALKASGAAVLRDGVYLMPDDSACRETLKTVADMVLQGGGSAWVLGVNEPEHGNFRALFDRGDDYATLLADIHTSMRQLATQSPLDVLKQARRLRKAFMALSDIDFFPGSPRAQAEELLQHLEASASGAISPDEPSAGSGPIPRRRIADFQGKQWATRERPWVDRLASAWLVLRFIDPAARFLWLRKPADCSADALGFDFDGATFTHVGDRVTFEVLLASFGLEAPGLERLGRLVHYLDVGGAPPAEAAGVESVLAGLRAGEPRDERLLQASLAIFDGLHAAFSRGDGK